MIGKHPLGKEDALAWTWGGFGCGRGKHPLDKEDSLAWIWGGFGCGRGKHPLDKEDLWKKRPALIAY